MNIDINERYKLACERIRKIPEEIDHMSKTDGLFYLDFFIDRARYIISVLDNCDNYSFDEIKGIDFERLSERNEIYYKGLSQEDYGSSFANPDFADERLGIYGKYLSFVAAELYLLPVIIHQRDKADDLYFDSLKEAVYLLELFIYLYILFCDEDKPKISYVEKAIYFYAFDYIEEISEDRFVKSTFPDKSLIADRIIEEADLSDPSYLYMYGNYISETEIKLSAYLASLSDEEIEKIADTYTGGFRRGFDTMRINFEGKKYVNIRYHIGQERIVRAAGKKFKAMGLEAVYSNSSCSRLVRKGTVKVGFESTSPNMQFEYDHGNDDSLFLDKKYVQRRLDSAKDFYQKYKDDIRKYAGPAVIESFGEKEFSPVIKNTASSYDDNQRKLLRNMYGRLADISNKYLPGDEYSFTIIAFPLPDIGDNFEEIFGETIKINTLDNDKYIKIQQHIIDVLDLSDEVRVIGMNGNKTDMTVKMRKLESPENETQFENCTADVNMPLGEVFTSPVLKGTHGTLNVSHAYLNGFSFKDLTLKFEDGVITDYYSEHTDGIDAARKYIKDNILFNHETLPIGEFAIGTNTYAYSVAKRYGIISKLPILIVEKTGPHFAVGDTCYSHAEDHKVYNPDGKEIISRENDFSILRNTEPEKAYFNCHTDITIPYNELGRLYTVSVEGQETDIIVNGRFVLPGTEELSEVL